MSENWYAPNQQAVHAGEFGPADEGEGGVERVDPPVAEPEEGQEQNLETMSKAEVLAYAKQLGVSPANNDMTKDELKTAIEQHQAGG